MTLSNDAPQSVGQISGSVVSAEDGSAIANAKVTLTDSAGTSRQATTNANGEFSWTPSNDQTLAAGQITATVDVDGYKQAKQTQNGTNGRPLAFSPFKLTKIAKAKPTKTHAKAPSPTPSQEPKEDDGGGLSTIVWVLIILGALLVVGGIVAIVLLMRKKDDDDDGPGHAGDGILPFHDGPEPTGYPRRGAGETAMINPVPGGDDAPTMVHNGPLVRDDGYPPYGNAGQTQVYGAENGQPYGGQTQPYGVNAPGGTQAYGGQTQAYGADAPGGATQVHGGETQVYGAQPPAGPPAGDATSTYGAPQGQGPAQPWQQSDRGVGGTYEGTMYGRGSGAAPTSGAAPASGAPTSGFPGPGAAPTSGYPGGQPTSGYPGGQPTSGAGPASGGGYPQSGGAPAGGYGQGAGYGQPAGPYGQPAGQQYGQGQQQYGQGQQYGQAGGQQYGQQRPELNEPTGVWQPGQQQPGQRQPGQPQQPRPAPPSGDETRLDRNDGVDWLD
jgi:hypothetical protein